MTARPDQSRSRTTQQHPWRRWVALLVVVVCLVVAFINLGQWQLRRLDERRGDNATVIAHEDAPVVDYTAAFTHPITDDDQWQRVTVTGTFDASRQLVARYRSYDGETGYEVVVPLHASDGRTVLVDRGFAIRPAGQDFPSAVAAPPTGTVTVLGYVRRNEQGPTNAMTPASGSVMLINSEAIGAAQQIDLVNGYISAIEMTPAQTGYTVVGPPELNEGPHLSYALQWFTFSLIALGGLVVFIRNDVRDRKKAEARAARAAAAAAAPPDPDGESAPGEQ